MTIQEIDSVLEEGESLKLITQFYFEVANIKIKKIRAQTERNKRFYEEISKIYSLVKESAVRKRINIIKPKKMVSIVLTSNYRFYGAINSDLLRFFINTTKKLDTDLVVVNKVAIDYFKIQPIFKNYTEVLLKGDQPDVNELTSLVNILKDYTQVLVFYSSFKSLLVQTPTVIDITASATNATDQKTPKSLEEQELRFIFEPELAKILAFFDNQVLTLLLEETFLESELARTASRLISMDQAETEANKLIKEYVGLRVYTKRGVLNNELLENFAARMALRKGGNL
ncbi:F0F1 ATP synthase subunit gamma [Patescibacteria group bacterium]|nr:F0F1 ATP synthase subunit gamma [Patescibacteria group bacterium]